MAIKAFKDTSATRKVFALRKRIRAVAGGTSASKTISILVWLIDYGQSTQNKLLSVVSESFPHLEMGVMKDFQDIMKAQGYWKDARWHGTKHTYTFETGTQLQFFSVDTYGKAHGPRRDVLFVNEANNLAYNIVDQLITRTREIVWLDWNPSLEFWFYTEMLPHRDDIDFITLTYKDNEALDANTIKEIESHKHNKMWWQVYGLGQLGDIEGKIYSGWRVLDELPETAKLLRYWLDFGYSNDPASIGGVYKYNDTFVLDEILYKRGMDNEALASVFLNQEEKALVVADSSEPKSIDEIAKFDVPIIGAIKGPDSINYGIKTVQSQKIFLTKRSVNTLKEYRSYQWKKDRNGKQLDVPEDGFDHCFAGDSLVHTTKGQMRIDALVGKTGFLYSKGGRIKRFYNVRPTRRDTEVVTLYFNDGNRLSVTPDHLLLQPDGVWIQAGLLRPSNLIQSVMYAGNKNIGYKTIIQWFSLLSDRKVFQELCLKAKVFTSRCLDISQWGYSQAYAYSSSGYGSYKQSNRKPGTFSNIRSLITSLDSRETRKGTSARRENTTTGEQVAWVKSGDGVALATWEENIREPRSIRERMHSLPYEVYNYTIRRVRSILSSKLQNESSTKAIAGVKRGREAVTYNLEVEDTHCLLVNGVIAHNSLDGIRYAITNIIKPEKKSTGVTRTKTYAGYNRSAVVSEDVEESIERRVATSVVRRR